MSQNTIHLQCRSCGGNLDVDRNQSLIFCPFCGSKELLVDSDAVAVEKIRQQTEFKKCEREDLQKDREEDEKYKNSKAGGVALVFAIICGLMFVGSATIIRSVPSFMRSLSLLLQTSAFLMSYLIRKETVRLPEKFQLKSVRTPTLLLAVGFALFIVTFILTAL